MWCFINRDGNFSNKQFFHGNIKGANALDIPGVQCDCTHSFNFLLQAIKVFSCILVSFFTSQVILVSPSNLDCNIDIAFYFLPAIPRILGRFIQCWQYTVVFSQENIWKITAIHWLPFKKQFQSQFCIVIAILITAVFWFAYLPNGSCKIRSSFSWNSSSHQLWKLKWLALKYVGIGRNINYFSLFYQIHKGKTNFSLKELIVYKCFQRKAHFYYAIHVIYYSQRTFEQKLVYVWAVKSWL